MDYFESLLALLRTERKEDELLYDQLLRSSTVFERRLAGLSWYPVAIRDTELGRGDYLIVELERTTHQEIPHQLRFGMPAALFSNHDPATNRISGIITHQSANKLRLTLRTDELPHWSREGKLGVDLLFDDNSYDEMEAALKSAAKKPPGKQESRLVEILTGHEKPGLPLTPESALVLDGALNASQQLAVQRILAAPELSIVHGPPGTGKTTTLVQAIRALWERDRQRILVVAPSNTAVDLLSEKLAESGLKVLRVGNPVRVSERLQSLTMDSQVNQHPSTREISKLKKRANEFRSMAYKYKRAFGPAERAQRKALLQEARIIMNQVEQTEQYILDDIINRAQVITATLVGANHYTVRQLRYETVVIDEAGQALEPACWIAILKAKKLVLGGDHLQLPPTVKSQSAAALSTTLLEKLVSLYPEQVTVLEEQYRMHRSIMSYSSYYFYEGRLRAHDSVAGRLLFTGDEPLLFIDTAGCGFEEKLEGTSVSNPEEAAFLCKHLGSFLESMEQQAQLTDNLSVAVISPYKEQVVLLRELADHHPVLKKFSQFISINTIDSFQGQERDLVYIGMTRSNTSSSIGFLSDIRRMNVAMTRARKKLVVIGDSGTLSVHDFYAGFISHAEQTGAYQSAWEFMSD